MNFHQLLQQRDALLRQARLANVAYAYQRLDGFAARIARGGLQGLVRLDPGDPAGERPWPGLTALEGNQSVIEEHFLEEDGVELVDILSFLGEEVDSGGATFRLEDLGARFLPGLRRELEQAGIHPAGETPRTEDPSRRT